MDNTNEISKDSLLNWFKELVEHDVSIPMSEKSEEIINRAINNYLANKNKD